MKDTLKNFIYLSQKMGERFDLVQAGGGNTSVKINDTEMLIKASGLSLSQIEETSGYVQVNYQDILKKLRTQTQDNRSLETAIIAQYTNKKGERPSIETFIHAYFYKYVSHLHPIVVNVYTAQSNWNEQLQQLFPTALMVPYKTPGIALAHELNARLKKYILEYKHYPTVTFLQNHGVIFSCDTVEEVLILTESTIKTLEQELNIDFSDYKNCNKISDLYNKIYNTNKICYKSSDTTITTLFSKNIHTKIFAPDILIYCGHSIVQATDLTMLKQNLTNFAMLKHEVKIIILNKNVYIIANSVAKAKEAEEVLKFSLLVHDLADENSIMSLSSEEIAFLSGWELEKFRQK